MIILISSKISQKNIHASLGKPEYSYFFLMKDFLPVLERIGTVIQAQTREEVETLYSHHSARGEQVIFLSVSPPHQTPLGLDCPTVSLFAWEFDSLPAKAWDEDPQNDWGYVFSLIHGAICTSREAAQLVVGASRHDFPVVSLPAPVWDRYAHLGAQEGWAFEAEKRQFGFFGTIIDSPMLGLSADGLVRKADAGAAAEQAAEKPSVCRARPRIGLRSALRLSVTMLRSWLGEMRNPGKPAASSASKGKLQKVSVAGVVYCTVLNPADGRKNWVDIVTAFCWAFRDRSDATLIVKMTHHDLEYYRVVLLTLLSRLSPFKCRVLVLHGFLEDEQYQQLIKASTFYVNASTGEGLCLPLMEFLSSGKPAIAPAHTAMADYLDPNSSFILRTCLEPACWPHDPTGMLLTRKHRLNWQSLMEAFRDSYELAKGQPQRYRDMSRAARQQMKEFASIERVAEPLEVFLQAVLSSQSKAKQENLQ